MPPTPPACATQTSRPRSAGYTRLWKYPGRTSKPISDVGWAKQRVPISRWVTPPPCMGTLRFAHPTSDKRTVFYRVGLTGGLLSSEGERFFPSAVSEKA